MSINMNKLEKEKAAKANAEAKAPVAEEVVAEEAVVETVATDPTLGVDRGKVAFVAPLGDPSNPDNTTTTDKVTKEKSTKTTSTIVGYRFRALENITIPDCGTTENFKKDPMDYAELEKFKEVKAGEEFDLTPFETAYLLSQNGFNGGCDGGEKPVICAYPQNVAKKKNGQMTVTAADKTPRVTLRAATGSIKEFDIIDVLTAKKEVNPATGRAIIERIINPGFEKWAPLCAVATRKTAKSAGAKKTNANVRNEGAASFMNFVNRKKGAPKA